MSRQTDRDRRSEREQMLAEIRARGVGDERVFRAMRAVAREQFVSEAMREHAYADSPLPIEQEQTISQPYIVAHMTELARIPWGGRVLEIGTGSGYGAAVLAGVAARVYTVE